jgi:hypothetical protein
MQFTDLNRTINLILVGTITIAAGVFVFFNQILGHFQPLLQTFTAEQIISAAPIVLLTLTVPFVALSIFFGIVVEGLADIFIRELILKYIKKSRLIQKLLFSDHYYELNDKLKKQFVNLLLNNINYSVKETMDEEEAKTFLAAIFHRTAQPEYSKLIMNSYSIHVLTAEFILIALTVIAVVPFLYYVMGWNINVIPYPWSIMVALLLYPLIYVTADRERYTYEASYRQGILVLSERTEASENKLPMQLVSVPDASTNIPASTPQKVTSGFFGKSKNKR